MNTIAVFRSRSQALAVYKYLQTQKIACITVNTPARFQVGCGISLVFNQSYIPTVQSAIKALSITSFVGFFGK